jgi:arginine decarboxylase
MAYSITDCHTIESPTDADDDIPFWAWREPSTITDVYCKTDANTIALVLGDGTNSLESITCDSDGCLEQFIDRSDLRKVLDLHSPSEDAYYLGFFLVGAYQESLANEHNLFGAINEAEITINEDSRWEIIKTTVGDPIGELLTCRNYDMDELKASFTAQLKQRINEGSIHQDKADTIFTSLSELIDKSPYLLENS